MSEQRQDKNLLSEPHKTESDEIEIDLVDIFRKIIAIRKKIIQSRWNWFYYWNNCSGKYP